MADEHPTTDCPTQTATSVLSWCPHCGAMATEPCAYDKRRAEARRIIKEEADG